MASTGVNVLRWSALGVGIIYGFYHQQSITSRDRAAAAAAEWAHKESLISQAKAEFAKKNGSQEVASKASSNKKADPKDPNADLNVLLGITDEK